MKTRFQAVQNSRQFRSRCWRILRGYRCHCWAIILFVVSHSLLAQINTGSDGHDGALNPTANMVINMADHPDGIYHYTSVNIPTNVTVTFIPNDKNTPVAWLIQTNCIINGVIDLSGKNGSYKNGDTSGGLGGPGGYRGGNGGPLFTSGEGPGGGVGGKCGANASYGSKGETNDLGVLAGLTYGNIFLLPMQGGSGGGGSLSNGGNGGGGGGGGILIAAAGTISLYGAIHSYGGHGNPDNSRVGGGGSGGAIRLIAPRIKGIGELSVLGGTGPNLGWWPGHAGYGRVRLDTYKNEFAGSIDGISSQGLQPIIMPTTGQLPQVRIATVAGIPVSASPTGDLTTPDSLISSQQNNPIPIVVQCSNIPLNTPITVSIKPMNASAVSVMGYNNSGTLAASTATVSIQVPRGGGLIYATATTVK